MYFWLLLQIHPIFKTGFVLQGYNSENNDLYIGPT